MSSPPVDSISPLQRRAVFTRQMSIVPGAIRVTANLSMLFADDDLLARYGKAAAAGFRLVEVPFPYDVDANLLQTVAAKHGLQHVLINAPAGKVDDGQLGLAATDVPKVEFQASIEKAVQYATTLGCKMIHVMAGKASSDDNDARERFVANIQLAADLMAEKGITCLIEPLSKSAASDYFLTSYDLALELMEEIGRRNVKLLFDVFHAQLSGGRLTENLRRLAPHIQHIQVAQVPARGSPQSAGEIDYSYLFDVLRSLNPQWMVGAEFKDHSHDHRSWVRHFNLSF